MTPARSVATSVVALGIASTLTAPLPALAAPASCTEPGHHAAQSGAELIRINRLELGAPAAATPEPATSATTSASPSASPSASRSAESALPEPDGDAAGRAPSGEAVDQAESTSGVRAKRATGKPISNVGLGDTRSVLIANGPVKSAAAARVLNGRVAGSAAHNDLVVQQAPPSNRKASKQRIGAKRFGPARVGAGALTAHARWTAGMACGDAGEVSSSATQLTRITVAGGGSHSLVRVPEKISGSTSTALRRRADVSEAVALATFQAGKLNLADGEVRIRVVRAATLQVSMSESGRGDVNYEPPVVEVTGQDGKITRLDTAGDRTEITLSEEARAMESLPSLITSVPPLPLPKVPGLPVPRDLETTPATGDGTATTLRISLGDVRQAAKGKAIAARATAVRVSLVRAVPDSRTKGGYAPSGVVADLGIGLLEGAAVAPKPAAAGVTPRSVADGKPGGAGAGVAGLPITGPGIMPLLLGGAGLVAGGIGALLLGARRRRPAS